MHGHDWRCNHSHCGPCTYAEMRKTADEYDGDDDLEMLMNVVPLIGDLSCDHKTGQGDDFEILNTELLPPRQSEGLMIVLVLDLQEHQPSCLVPIVEAG